MPSLYADNGPQAGRTYELHVPEIVIGRHPDCAIHVDVGAVSRQHAKIVNSGGQYFVEDMQSRNGTTVNGQTVHGRRRLKPGDKISVCDVTFTFGKRLSLTSRDDEPSSFLLVDQPSEGSRVMSRLDILGGSQSGSLSIATSADAKLRALIDITQGLSRTLAVEKVLPQLLDSLFRLFVQADRGFIILRDEDGKLIPRFMKQRRDNDDRMLRISKTILDEVVESRQAILSTDTTGDERFAMSDSIADFRIRSFICAPLIDVEGNVLGAIQLDSLDHRNRFRDDDLALLGSVAGQAAIAIDNANLHEQLVRQHVLERDLELAQEVQRGYLPQSAPQLTHYDLHDFYQPADMVGGDYYDYITLPDGRTAVILADVVGHGMAAALQTAQLSVAIRFSLAAHRDPAMAIAALNETLMESSLDDRFITLVLVLLYPDSGRVTIVNAGHNPPLLCRGDEEPRELGTEVRNFALLVESLPYTGVDVELLDGDRLVLYTDGVNESMNAAQDTYGLRRMKDSIRGRDNGDDLICCLIEDVRQYVGDATQKDDICLVCCSRHV